MSHPKPVGVIRDGWTQQIEEYAISGGWTKGGDFLITGDSAGNIYVFDGKKGTQIWSHKNSHEFGLLDIAVHPDQDQFASSGQDGRILIWGASDWSLLHEIDCDDGWVDNLSWSPNGDMLAASCSRKIFIFNKFGDEIWRSEKQASTISAIAWSESKEIASACYGQVTFFDSSSGNITQEFKWKGSLVSMVISPDGDIVACGSQDNSVHFWRRSTSKDSMMSGYSFKPSALAFDQSGVFLATGGSDAVTVWNFEGNGPEGTAPGILEFHSQPISKLTFSSRRGKLASTARDGTVVVWDLNKDGSGEPVGIAKSHDVVGQLAWRPDGRAIAALGSEGHVTVWKVG